MVVLVMLVGNCPNGKSSWCGLIQWGVVLIRLYEMYSFNSSFNSNKLRYERFLHFWFPFLSWQVMIIPLVISSLIAGMASLDQQASGKLGLRAVLYYFTTTFIAVILGIILVMTIRPGRGKDMGDIDRQGSVEPVNTADAFLDLLR